MLGSTVATGPSGEYGKEIVHAVAESPLFASLPKEQVVWYSHGDEIKKLPKGFQVIGRAEHGPLAAVEHSAKRLYGLQFHPEVSHTEYGLSILQNFAIDICQDPADWTIQQARQSITSQLSQEITDGDVLVGVSGGVDSLVAATLLEKLGLTIVEPLKELYKDEVRELGLELHLPKHLIDRHPFPGPGLAI